MTKCTHYTLIQIHINDTQDSLIHTYISDSTIALPSWKFVILEHTPTQNE